MSQGDLSSLALLSLSPTEILFENYEDKEILDKDLPGRSDLQTMPLNNQCIVCWLWFFSRLK